MHTGGQMIQTNLALSDNVAIHYYSILETFQPGDVFYK